MIRNLRADEMDDLLQATSDMAMAGDREPKCFFNADDDTFYIASSAYSSGDTFVFRTVMIKEFIERFNHGFDIKQIADYANKYLAMMGLPKSEYALSKKTRNFINKHKK